MPLRSFHLLPPEYKQIPAMMMEQYPSNFDVDLNGKTNAWEAIVLIPFVDESEVIANEKTLYDNGLQLIDSDRKRNSIAFEYYMYKYHSQNVPKQLKSTLTNFTDQLHDFTTC